MQKNNGIILSALKDSILKLNPVALWQNPVIFLVAIGSLITTYSCIVNFIAHNTKFALFGLHISLWLWFTVLFANFAESLAEGRGKVHTDFLKQLRKTTPARLFNKDTIKMTDSLNLKKGDLVIVKVNEVIPMDGTVVYGAASIDESSITGESAPVIREAGGDRSAVTGGTLVLSDEIHVLITVENGQTFLDKMIALVEGSERRKTPNEVAITILLVGLSFVFLAAVITLKPFAAFQSHNINSVILVALAVCLIPTTIGGLLTAIGLAGVDRVLKRNVIATSGRAIEAAGDIDVLLLDKTGTITIGNRMATKFVPADDKDRQVSENLAKSALMASLGDDTPEGRSIVKLATSLHRTKFYGLVIGTDGKYELPSGATIIPFTAQTRMSGIDIDGTFFRKGALSAIEKWLAEFHKDIPQSLKNIIEKISKEGSTPLVVATQNGALGVIYLKDIVKSGLKERFEQLRKMGVKTVIISGDNKYTTQVISEEAGVDDFVAEATPEDKLKLVKKYKNEGQMVAMTGDGTNDAPALAQADVGLVMNTGTQAAREAGNMIDLNSDPTKIIEIIEIGKQLLMTRGSITTFSIANDVAKYFAIISALYLSTHSNLSALNILGLGSPESAVLSSVIFNAIIIVLLIPLALRGVHYKANSATKILRKNLLIYGVGGIIAPFIGIKLIDMLINSIHLL